MTARAISKVQCGVVRATVLGMRVCSAAGAAMVAGVLAGCGGGASSSAGAKNVKEPGAGDGDSIGAMVAEQGGLPSLGGGGGHAGGDSGMSGGTLRADLVEKDAPVKLDGILKEWPGLTLARTVVKGSGDGLTFRCAVQYDAQSVYFAGDVTGATLRHVRRFTEDEDHASLIVAAPTGGAVEVSFFAGKPGELAGQVRSGGHEVPGAKIVEAENDKGYTFEASVPWSVFAPPLVRVGLRGVARYYNAGASPGIKNVVATGDGDTRSPRDMPALPTEPEQSLIDSFLGPKNLLGTAPKFELLADVGGDALKERIAVYDHFLTVLGPGYRGGKEFFYRDLGADIVKLDARDVTGRGKQDLIVRRQFGGADTREWIDVLAFLSDEPATVFSHEISVVQGSNKVTNAVHIGSKEIDVAYDPAVGWDSATYKQPYANDTEPLILPWGAVKSQTYKFDGSKFVKANEVAQKPTGPAAQQTTATVTHTSTATHPPEPPTPQQRPGGDLSHQMLAQFRADRGIPDSVHPRFDAQVHVDGDARPERVVLLGRDIVVFGPGFKNGTAYAYITLSQFADAADIEEVTTRDLTGDGAADLIVRGVRHVSAQGAGTIDLHCLFVYQVKNENLTRVFAIETARAQGQKRIQGLVQFVPGSGGKSFDVDVRPGRAQGWTDKTYPFGQDQPGGALEPLLLPWGGVDHLRYTWSGAAFTRVP